MSKDLSHLTVQQEIEVGLYNKIHKDFYEGSKWDYNKKKGTFYIDTLKGIKERGILPIKEIAPEIYRLIHKVKEVFPDFCAEVYSIIPKELEEYKNRLQK